MKIFKIFAFREVDPTKGSIIKNTFEIAKPLWYMTIFWIAVHLMNLYWVSRLGEEAIAAVAIGGAAFTMLMAVIQGISATAISLVGGFNRHDKTGLDKLVKQILSTTWLLSILVAILGYFFASNFLQILGAGPEVTPLAATYLRIVVVGGIISFSSWPINDIIRATRDMFRPMLLVGLVLLLQGVLDYLLILGNFGLPKLGVAGAGLSVAISASIGAGLGFWMLATGKLFLKINLREWRDFKIQPEIFRKIISISGFATFQGFARAVVDMAMLKIITPFGTPALAALGIGQRFLRYPSVFCMDLGKTANITVSNNLGEGDIKRAEKSGWVISVIAAGILGFTGLMFFIFAGQIVGFFSSDPQVLTIGVSYFRLTTMAGFAYIFVAIGSIIEKAFVGAKDTKTPMLVYWCTGAIQVGLALILSKFTGLGINGVWVAIATGMIFHGSVLAILFKLGRWKKGKK